LGVQDLAPERRELRWEAPREAWRSGANQLEAIYAYARAPHNLNAISGDMRNLSVAWFGLRVEGPAMPAARVVSTKGAQGLLLPFDRPLDFYVEAGERLELRWSGLDAPDPVRNVGLRAQTCGDDGRCARPIEAIVGHGPQRLVLPGGPGPQRVVLQSLWHGDERPSFDGPVLVEPELGPTVAPGGAREPAVAPEGQARHWPSANVIVYLVDTLRADRLGVYGYDRATSPRLDALARQSIVFDRAYANAPWTLPAVTSVMTGLYPWTHGVEDVGKSLDPNAVTLPKILAAAGYETAAFLTNGVVGRRSGLGAGFSVYRQIPEDTKSETIHARAETLNTAALSWLDQRRGSAPFFLYLHASDPHAPYRPPAAQRERFAPSVPVGEIGSTQILQRLVNEPRADDGRYAAPMSELYDGEVAYTDEAFGKLLDEIERRGLLKNTIVVFLADHGEALYEHHVWGHEWWLYEELIRIPLLVRLPGAQPSGGRNATVVQQVDLMPTILELVGLPIPAGVQGRSLLPILEGVSVPPRRAYSGVAESRISWAEIDGTHKTIVHQHNAAADVGRDGIDLFDLATDPHELADGTATTPVTAGAKRTRVLTEVWRHGRHATVAAPPIDLEVLRSLGYVR
jgi:arylsulfatase A-like enzyme